ncbi:cytochrome c oxidase subunit 3 [Methylocystis sp. MJC1]|uniref:cytochrome c oxidase subunit 3 n=1 Tax=Methylocystis sp. MJC1 TaxID=2654282 RepID=UPI001FEEE718|nr:cytochrome c oxidase subunit 3 [Methylocystis sp. MJC1]KAF2989929.1 Cytochrome c oxidase polypeptide I+III [Methylocystis sp. MJC1]UZX11211.1 cytochrome c oxidase subunit 3 [Methylocystis sp. MJC1]
MADTTIRRPRLPVGSIGHKSFGWWGMIAIIMSEGSLFAYLLFSYYYFAVQYGRDWIPEMPDFTLAAPNTAVLLSSSLFVWWGERSATRGRRAKQALGLAIGLALGTIFLIVQYLEWGEKPFTYSSTSYGSSYFITTGFHMAHVAVGAAMLAAVLLWSLLGYFDSERHAPISIAAVYWHFVDLVWLAIFFTFYVTPYLGVG